MKKIILMSFIIFGVIFFAGCSTKTYEPNIHYEKYTKPSDLFREIGMKKKGDEEWRGRLDEIEKYLEKYCEHRSGKWQTREGLVKGFGYRHSLATGEIGTAAGLGYEKDGYCKNKNDEVLFRMHCKRGQEIDRSGDKPRWGAMGDNCYVVDTDADKRRMEDIKVGQSWYFQGQ